MTDEQINPDELNLAITEHHMDRISELKKENDTLRKQLQAARDSIEDQGKQILNLMKKLKKERKRLQAARDALAEIREVWAGSDGFVAETAPEAYQRRLLVRGYEIAVKALAAGGIMSDSVAEHYMRQAEKKDERIAELEQQLAESEEHSDAVIDALNKVKKDRYALREQLQAARDENMEKAKRIFWLEQELNDRKVPHSSAGQGDKS